VRLAALRVPAVVVGLATAVAVLKGAGAALPAVGRGGTVGGSSRSAGTPAQGAPPALLAPCRASAVSVVSWGALGLVPMARSLGLTPTTPHARGVVDGNAVAPLEETTSLAGAESRQHACGVARRSAIPVHDITVPAEDTGGSYAISQCPGRRRDRGQAGHIVALVSTAAVLAKYSAARVPTAERGLSAVRRARRDTRSARPCVTESPLRADLCGLAGVVLHRLASSAVRRAQPEHPASSGSLARIVATSHARRALVARIAGALSSACRGGGAVRGGRRGRSRGGGSYRRARRRGGNDRVRGGIAGRRHRARGCDHAGGGRLGGWRRGLAGASTACPKSLPG
jgi:hypothetical protein